MRKERDFIRAHKLTMKLRGLYQISRECNDAAALCHYYKALEILADPTGSAPTVISMHDAAFLITDASWSSITYDEPEISEILALAYELELPKSLVKDYYSKWKLMSKAIDRAMDSFPLKDGG